MSEVRLIIFIIGILFIQKGFSQVTIGSSKTPVEGALLQLKENENIGDNSTKGLLLPRVELLRKDKLSPMLDNSNFSDNVTTHRGLMVYNTSLLTNENLFPGLYVWDGKKWKGMRNDYTFSWYFKNGLGDWVRNGAENQIITTNDYLKIVTRPNTNDRVKVSYNDIEFREGKYQWRVYVSDLEMKSRCSIGAFIYCDDNHEIDFEIASGTEIQRTMYSAQDEEVLVFMTSQANPFAQKVITIKKENGLLLISN